MDTTHTPRQTTTGTTRTAGAIPSGPRTARPRGHGPLHNLPCWVLGHTYRHTPGDADVLTCPRCGRRELVSVKRMVDSAQRLWF